ncbi:translation initiation factor IF-2-like [Pteropus medius]|uniref:translation initiation factor IF-2-like n=1 Tax=Pteropus vampyrus TaxID=132908 RepID=UPI00196ABD39|nr:translation initiation factor IF-2-like [Pteropus giganteus]
MAVSAHGRTPASVFSSRAARMTPGGRPVLSPPGSNPGALLCICSYTFGSAPSRLASHSPSAPTNRSPPLRAGPQVSRALPIPLVLGSRLRKLGAGPIRTDQRQGAFHAVLSLHSPTQAWPGPQGTLAPQGSFQNANEIMHLPISLLVALSLSDLIAFCLLSLSRSLYETAPLPPRPSAAPFLPQPSWLASLPSAHLRRPGELPSLRTESSPLPPECPRDGRRTLLPPSRNTAVTAAPSAFSGTGRTGRKKGHFLTRLETEFSRPAHSGPGSGLGAAPCPSAQPAAPPLPGAQNLPASVSWHLLSFSLLHNRASHRSLSSLLCVEVALARHCLKNGTLPPLKTASNNR